VVYFFWGRGEGGGVYGEIVSHLRRKRRFVKCQLIKLSWSSRRISRGTGENERVVGASGKGKKEKRF